MAKTPVVQKEPLHLLFLRSLVHTGAVLLLLGPLTAGPVLFTAVGTALAGLALGRWLAASRLRTPVLLLGAAGFVLLGLGLHRVLGASPRLAASLGIRGTLAVTEGVLFGPGTFGIVFALRILAARRPVLALLEVTAVAAAVVLLFAGHRDYQLGRPRLFSDWAFANGYEPLTVLRGVGLVTLVGLGLLLLPWRRLSWTLGALALLALLGGVCGLFGWLALAGGEPEVGSRSASAASHDPLNFHDRPPNPEDPTPAALVTFREDFHPVDETYHLRRRTYSELSGTRLAPCDLDRAYPDVPQAFPQERVQIPGERLPDGMSREIDLTVALLAPERTPLCFVSPVVLEPRDNPDPSSFRVVYDCRARVLIDRVYLPPPGQVAGLMGAAAPIPLSALPWLAPAGEDLGLKGQSVHPYTMLALRPAGDPAWPEAVRRQYLAYPDDPRYLELGDRLIAGAVARGELPAALKDSSFARALVLMRWIRKNTVYTCRPGNGQMPDPTADFLFGSHEGFCVHVAHAMAFLLRAQGVPTRIGVGYAMDERRRPPGASILFTGGDGHAWCELYLRGVGWVPIDGSPERTKDPPLPRPDSALVEHLRDKLNGEAPPPAGKGPLDGVLGVLRLVLPRVARIVPLMLLAVLYAVKGWRRLAPRIARAGQLYRVCFRSVLDRLAEVGVRRRFGETREEFARRLAVLGPEFEELTAAHVRRAIAGLEAFDRPRWEALKVRVEARIAQTFPRTRRLLGAVNPVSWIWAR
jgi:hypothetical protein